MATTDSSPNAGLQEENMQNSLEHNICKEFFDAVDEVYTLLQSQNALHIKQLNMLFSKLEELRNISIPQGQLLEFINSIVNYIEIVLTFISSFKDYTKQKELVLNFLYMIPHFFNKPEEIKGFIKEATVKMLELFMFGNFSIVSNRELLTTFNSVAIKSTKEVRTAVAEKTLYYMYKLIDSLSTHGDYGLQADIMETLFRIYGSHIRGKKIKYDLLPGSAELSEELATNISNDNFDLHVRHWLNKFNQNSSLIFTLPCQQLIFGDVAIKNIEEFGSITWLDFDLKEQIVGFYMEGRDASWNRVIFFARNVSNVNVNRKFTTNNKVTTVNIILSKPCISEAMDSQDYCNSLSKELKIVISNEERDKITKLISHVLPKIFGDVFTHSSTRVSQKLKQVYKPLRMKVSKSVSRRRSLTDVENLNVPSKSTTLPIHTAQENIFLPEIKYSHFGGESNPSISAPLFSYGKEHVQQANRSEQNGESGHNYSFVLTEFSRTDVASDRASLIPSRNSDVLSNRGSSNNATHVSQVQSDGQVQDNIVTSSLAFEDDIPLSSTIEIISGHCQRSHSCSLIAENVEFKHSEVFSSSPVKRSNHNSQFQLIENIFCSTQFHNEDIKGIKTSVFKASEEITSDKYKTAAANLDQLEQKDVLRYQEMPRFDVVEINSQKETVTINKKFPEELDVFPTITKMPLGVPVNKVTESTTSQDLFVTTQRNDGSYEVSVNNSKYILDMHIDENKEPETQTSSEDKNFTELSRVVNVGVASDMLFSEPTLPSDGEGKVQSSEIVEVFIDLTDDEPNVEKHVEKPNIEPQLQNISVDADMVRNTTNSEVLPILKTKGLFCMLGENSKHEYGDKGNTKTSSFKASEEVVSDQFETAVENLMELELEAAPHYEAMPHIAVVEIKSQNETVTIEETPEESDIFPTIMKVPLVTPVNYVTEGTTSQDLFVATQRNYSCSEISVNNSRDIFDMRTQENKKKESQTFLEDQDKIFSELNAAVDIGAASNVPFSELAALANGGVRIQNGKVIDIFIDLTEDEPDVEKYLDKSHIDRQLKNMDLNVDVVQNATDGEEMLTLNTQESLSVLDKSSKHESTDKGAMSPKISTLPPTITVIENKSCSDHAIKRVQRRPRRLIKMGKKLFRLDHFPTTINTSDEGPTMDGVNSKTTDVSTKKIRAVFPNTLKEVQTIKNVQKKIDETPISVNSKIVDENLMKSATHACITVKDNIEEVVDRTKNIPLDEYVAKSLKPSDITFKNHLEDVIESVVKNVGRDEFGTESPKQTHNTFKNHIEEIIDNVARNVEENPISIKNKSDDPFVRKSPKSVEAEREQHYNCSVALRNFDNMPLRNLDDVNLKVGMNESGNESPKDYKTRIILNEEIIIEQQSENDDLNIPDDTQPNCYDPPRIETSFTSVSVNPGKISQPTKSSESDLDSLQRKRKSQKVSQESRVSDLILKKSAKRLTSNDSMEALPPKDSEDNEHTNCNNPPQIKPTLKQISIRLCRMVIPHPVESLQSDVHGMPKTYMFEKASSELGMNNFILKKAARPLARDDSRETLATEQVGQKDLPEKSKALNASFNTRSSNLKETNFMEHVDNSSIVSVSSSTVTTVAAIHYANNEDGSPKETMNNNSYVITAHTRPNSEEQTSGVTTRCNDNAVIKTTDDFPIVQRNSRMTRNEVDTHTISNEGVYISKSPPNKSDSHDIQNANSPILTINKNPKVVPNRLGLKTKKKCENYIEADHGIDEILQLWNKKEDNDKNEKESDKIGTNSRRVLYREGSLSYLDDMELMTRATPEMSQTPELIELSSKKKKTKKKQQKNELLSTKETTRKYASLGAKKTRQSVKPLPLLYDPVASKNLREIFEKACENIFNKTAQNCNQIDPMNRTFGFSNMDIAVRGVEDSENSHHSPVSPAKIRSPESPQFPELETPPDLTWPEIETVPKPAINVLQHIVVPSQAPKRPLSVEHSLLESAPPKRIRIDENTLPPSIPIISNHTLEITSRALAIITYVCTLANQRNEVAATNLQLILDFIERLRK